VVRFTQAEADAGAKYELSLRRPKNQPNFHSALNVRVYSARGDLMAVTSIPLDVMLAARIAVKPAATVVEEEKEEKKEVAKPAAASGDGKQEQPKEAQGVTLDAKAAAAAADAADTGSTTPSAAPATDSSAAIQAGVSKQLFHTGNTEVFDATRKALGQPLTDAKGAPVPTPAPTKSVVFPELEPGQDVATPWERFVLFCFVSELLVCCSSRSPHIHVDVQSHGLGSRVRGSAVHSPRLPRVQAHSWQRPGARDAL
jgi:hypothetical protein